MHHPIGIPGRHSNFAGKGGHRLGAAKFWVIQRNGVMDQNRDFDLGFAQGRQGLRRQIDMT